MTARLPTETWWLTLSQPWGEPPEALAYSVKAKDQQQKETKREKGKANKVFSDLFPLTNRLHIFGLLLQNLDFITLSFHFIVMINSYHVVKELKNKCICPSFLSEVDQTQTYL